MFDLQKTDKPRFICSLFVASPMRTQVQALLAWNVEIARIKETVSEPMVGHIRFQWWREALEEIYSGADVRKHPVAEALAKFATQLPRQYFEVIFDARQEALEAEPEDIQGFAHSTSGALNMLIARVLGEKDTQNAAEIGKVYALAGMKQAQAKLSDARKLHPFFQTQARIASYWLNHPKCLDKGGLPIGLLLRLL